MNAELLADAYAIRRVTSPACSRKDWHMALTTEFRGKEGIIYEQRRARSRLRVTCSVAAFITSRKITPPVGVGKNRNTKKAKGFLNIESTRPSGNPPSCARTTENPNDNTIHVHSQKRKKLGPSFPYYLEINTKFKQLHS